MPEVSPLRVLIVDDELPARTNLRRHLQAYDQCRVIAEAEDGEQALRLIDEHHPDVVLLDIQMPGLSGLDVAQRCQVTPMPLFVFITAYDAHALRAFDLNAVDYLLKPFDARRFAQMINKLLGLHSLRDAAERSQQISHYVYAEPPRILVPDEEGMVPVDIHDIVRVEAAKDWVALVFAERQIILRKTLTSVAELLGSAFHQVHRSHLVRVGAIRKLDALGKGDYLLYLSNGDQVRMSRRFSAPVLRELGTLV